MNAEECQFLANALQQVLGTDNVARKEAEEKVNQIKREAPEKYAVYLSNIMQVDSPYGEEVKSLAAVILRRNISAVSIDSQDMNQENNANLWERLTPEAREAVKGNLLKVIAAITNKSVMHKICNLLVEVAGAIYEYENSAIWQDLLNLLFTFVNSNNELQIDAALQIFNGLFSYIMEHLVKYKDDLMGIFQQTMGHANLDIRLASLQAVSNYLQIAEGKDTKQFQALLPNMVEVVTTACEKDDETVLEDALVEFNEMAEIEPKFFKPHFKDVYERMKPIVGKSDFANNTIRHQPIEFFVTLIERQPSVVKKNEALLKDLLELIFRLMIDIDADIDEAWLKPKEGFNVDEDAEEEDNVNFGKGCVDRLVSAIGEEMMLPLIGQLVQNTISNEDDWRYKHAGIMAFSQVGEYVDDVSKLAQMMPVIVQHLQHANPKIRYAALHCLGQLADDLPEDFQQKYAKDVLGPIVQCLDDAVPRVQSHACAALTNFYESASEEIALQGLQEVCTKLCNLIKVGISLVKENASTTLAAVAEQAREGFKPYFTETLKFLIEILNEFHSVEYKQLRGQVIESITIICAAVGEEAFAPVANDVIAVMLNIQNTQLDSKDAQRIYLLSAWERICLLMKKAFTPYLKDVLPSVFTMASLNPEMGIQGQDKLSSLVDVLSEVKPESKDNKTINITTDELEEKNVAIQMLTVFIDELGSGFAEYVEPASKIILSLTSYAANDSIRTNCASALSGLIKCVKEAQPGNQAVLFEMGKAFNENLFTAMKTETETEVLISQVQAMKDCIEEIGPGFLNQEQISFLSNYLMEMITASLGRILENEKMKQEEVEDEDDELEEGDLALLKEENNNEHDLQLTIAEMFGALFKTHKELVGPLVQELRANVLPNAFNSEEQKRNKFGIFILDDMVEHLGPAYFGENDFNTIVETICRYANHKSSSLRQASGYGIGMVAQCSGAAFAGRGDMCLQALKQIVEFKMPPSTEEKKIKVQQFHHAKDNGIAGLGKVIFYQKDFIMGKNLANDVIPFWLSNLPIHHDVEEGYQQYDMLAELVQADGATILGADYANLPAVLKIFGEVLVGNLFSKEKKTDEKIAALLKQMASTAGVADAFQNVVTNVLS